MPCSRQSDECSEELLAKHVYVRKSFTKQEMISCQTQIQDDYTESSIRSDYRTANHWTTEYGMRLYM